MALKKTVNGKEVYVRIIRSNISKFSTPEIFVQLYQMVTSQVDGQEAAPILIPIGQSSITVPNDEVEFFSFPILDAAGMNHIKRSYEYLKTLPHFGDYEDA